MSDRPVLFMYVVAGMFLTGRAAAGDMLSPDQTTCALASLQGAMIMA